MPISFQERILLYRAAHSLIPKDSLEQLIKGFEQSHATFQASRFCQHAKMQGSALSLAPSDLATFEQKLLDLVVAEGGQAAAAAPPVAAPVAAPAAPLRTGPARPPDQVVFDTFLERILGSLGLLGAGKLGGAFDGARSAPALPGDYGKAIEAWSKNPTSLDTSKLARINLAQMRRIVDYLYGKSCVLVGPMKTDQLFSRAVTETEAIPESFVFSPRKFL